MTAEHQEHLPFLIDVDDIARIYGVSKATVNRKVALGVFPIPHVRLSERIVRFKRPDVEAELGAPLSVLAPWLISEKEPA